ncbi:class I SAM-dependent methyltransferase [Mucilaginibacter sp.]|uniref:class I SAM-dependent methyltransferase n=1 Tax=Mucilaginibacter sp. TaxID=1882438 RepID=UPI00260237C9|nr:class I SAM-dependent methyltransferase [Mucilaginibacter sp.]MDB4919621.1 glycosyl transferase group 1 [Mucilaginibacter sp.]
MNIVPQGYWDAGYHGHVVKSAPDDDAISQLIKKYIPPALTGQQAFEIGCFPARFLCILGDLGYVLNGVDATPNVIQLKESLEKLGYQVGGFENNKFQEIKNAKYDVVASFGFIEHFLNWEDVTKAHIEFLKPGGYLLITTPNFKGIFQYLYHWFLDNKNLKRHIVKSMSPKKWKLLLQQSGMKVIADGYTGYEFWDETPQKNKIQRAIKKGIIKLADYVHRRKPTHQSIASYCYIVAKNK